MVCACFLCVVGVCVIWVSRCLCALLVMCDVMLYGLRLCFCDCACDVLAVNVFVCLNCDCLCVVVWFGCLFFPVWFIVCVLCV